MNKGNQSDANRVEALDWAMVRERLEGQPGKLRSLLGMEDTGGEPDLIGFDGKTDEYVFCDCAAETPKGRRSLCYDREARESRKKTAPERNAIDLAAELGIELLSEAGYRALQTLGEFDRKTSSWLLTPPAIRKLGGAIFADRR